VRRVASRIIRDVADRLTGDSDYVPTAAGERRQGAVTANASCCSPTMARRKTQLGIGAGGGRPIRRRKRRRPSRGVMLLKVRNQAAGR
jgi:hypothetical protein